MVIPFSNTKLRVPTGFQSLLVGLSTEVLRSQPRNIHAFAADYFEKLLKRRDQGHSTGLENQTKLDDRYYNNNSFQDEYPVNDPQVNHAATKIQANFRGHKVRREVENLKRENKQTIDTDEQELGYTSDERLASPPQKEEAEETSRSEYIPPTHENLDLNQFQAEELTAEEKEEQERAARAIQARFRGHRDRKSTTPPQSARSNNQETESDRTAPTAPLSDRHEENLFNDDQVETGENEDSDRPRLEREPTQLSEDFERHTQVPRDSDFHREFDDHHPTNDEGDEPDLDDPNLAKAATKIQASFRGYKARKELGSSNAHSATDGQEEEEDHEQHDASIEEDQDEETAAAAVKIQAAYRGYRTRKDLDK